MGEWRTRARDRGSREQERGIGGVENKSEGWRSGEQERGIGGVENKSEG